MRQRIYAGLLIVSSLSLMPNCGSDDSSDNGDTTDSGGSGGSAGSGGSSDGGTAGNGGSTSGTPEGGSAGEPPIGEPVACPSDIDDMPARLAESICAKRVECCVTDVDVCITEVLDVLAGIYPDLDEAEESETAALDCAAFDACALAIHEASCSEWPFQGGTLGGLPVDEPACLDIITPTATDGEDCRYNYECIDGLCRVPEGETVGACDEFANLNDSCDDVCNPVTMFCNDANVCQERLPNGASCTNHDHCESRVCDIGGSDECVEPGPDQCAYIPNGTAHCALASAPGSRQTGSGSLALIILAGLAASAARRRRAASSDSL